ncbi:hypothetical protein LCGC14_1655080 [marine sediment metagenome]|uniref:Uncharacterized protein n=1 Tax=marine sediment metagenome TaxID=412755 RepID=A0A0F9KW03_9ZZZZ
MASGGSNTGAATVVTPHAGTRSVSSTGGRDMETQDLERLEGFGVTCNNCVHHDACASLATTPDWEHLCVAFKNAPHPLSG